MKFNVLPVMATVMFLFPLMAQELFSITVKPGNCGGASPGPAHCSCWATYRNGEVLPGSGWRPNSSGNIACDGGENNNCPHASINPPVDPPDSEFFPSDN